MEAFAFTDLLDNGPGRRVLAKVSLQSRDSGGHDVKAGVPYRPNHNFGDEENRRFYIGQIEVPREGLRAGETHSLQIIFLSGPGLKDVLNVGRRWRIQEGGKLVATAEILEVHDEV